MTYPQMRRFRRDLSGPVEPDIAAAVDRELTAMNLSEVRGGDRVAVAVGSRGIANLAAIVGQVVAFLKAADARPFLLPAMGSHGGATPEGQARVLSGYGLTEDALGVPVFASMETRVVGRSTLGFDLHVAADALDADHVMLVNRIKPHTNFAGPIESGLHKMLLIGLGKKTGTEIYHRAMQTLSFPQVLADVAPQVAAAARVLGGLAVIENGLDQTARLVGVRADRMAEEEPPLLNEARRLMPRLPLPDVDLLIVDRIGKNVSGSGMDTNVIGRKFTDHIPPHGQPGDTRDAARCLRILARDLTDATEGNAYGIGLAEFTVRRLADKVDWRKTAVNVLTAGHPTAGMCPLVFETDRQAVDAALGTLGLTPPRDARVLQIADTMHLATFAASEATWDELADAAPVDEPQPLCFDADGQLADL